MSKRVLKSVKAPSRFSAVRTALREISSEELHRELQRRKEPDFQTNACADIGDEDLIREYDARELHKYRERPDLALDMLRYALEDKDWRKAREAYRLLTE